MKEVNDGIYGAEEYKKINDNIHVPEELMNRTVQAVKAEERKQRSQFLWKYAAMAACICIVCFGAWRITKGDRIIVQDVTFSSEKMEIGLNLGNAENKQETETESVHIETYTSEEQEEIPEEMWELKASRINGEKVYLGRTEDGALHAAYKKESQIWYVTEESGDEEFFIEYLKNNL